MTRRRAAALLVFSAIAALAATKRKPAPKRRRAAKARPKYTNYSVYVRKFADTLLQVGLDTCGLKKTPLWAGVVDASTLTIPKDGVPAPPGIRESDRAVGGCNLYHDAVTLRAFRILSALTGQLKYAAAARQYIEYFLENATNAHTGFLGWGEHLYYDLYRDSVASERKWHELLEWTPPWAELWEVNQDAVNRAIQALRYHYYSDDGAALFNRHASWEKAAHQAPGGQPWIKHSGLFAYSFMFLYKRTNDRQWLAWSRAAGELYWQHRNPSTNLTLSCIDDPRPSSKMASSGMALLAYWLLKAYQLNPRETQTWIQALALLKAYDQYFYDERHQAYRDNVNLDGSLAGDGHAAVWDFTYGAPTILPIGRVAAFFARTEKEPVFLEMARRVARFAKESPVPPKVSIEGLAFALNLSLDLYDVTKEAAYLDDARAYADNAIRRFWVPTPSGGLFVRQPRDRYYEAKTGVGDLLAGMLRLTIRQGSELRDPALYDWSF